MVSSISAETERPRYIIRPAQTGHGIIKEGRLEAGTAALWRINVPDTEMTIP
jgi:hypothetical protein